MSFTNGETVKPLKVKKDCKSETGTELTFYPSKSVFTMTEFNRRTLETRLRELAFLNTGVNIILGTGCYTEDYLDEQTINFSVEDLLQRIQVWHQFRRKSLDLPG